jgi:putative DNA primase/helicase
VKSSALSVAGCPHWTLGVVAAFAGLLVSLIGLDTCGVNLSGQSSSGKSTAQRLAVSAWSTPDIRRPGLSQSARATDNATEALAERATGTILSMDELAHVNGKVVQKLIYMLAGGVGKRRMTPDAKLRESYCWSTFAILSAECSLEEKIRADEGEWLAGMAVRIVDIDVTDIDRKVDPETLRSIDQIGHHYGHAGPAFVRAMISKGVHRQAHALRDRVLAASHEIAGAEADSAVARAATPFALLLIAGQLAKVFGILPERAAVVDAVNWAWDRFLHSSDSRALDPEAQALSNLRRYVAERWDVTIKSVGAMNGNKEAVGWYDEYAVYVPKERIREATGDVLKETHIGAALDRAGLLAKREPDRFTVPYVPKVGRVTSYALRRSEVGRSDAAQDPASIFTVYKDAADD